MTTEHARAILDAMAARDECMAQARKLSQIIDKAHTRYMREVGLYGIRQEAFRRELERLAGDAQ